MIELSHVAILVRSADRAAEKLRRLGLSVNPPDTFEDGAVREIYIGDCATHSALPLLVEPVKRTAHARTFLPRGFGLHHLAVNVPQLEPFVDALHDSGWLLHPWSLEAARTMNTAYLCRPGAGFVVEVQRAPCDGRPPLVERVALPLSRRSLALAASAGLGDAVVAADAAELFFANRISIRLAELLE